MPQEVDVQTLRKSMEGLGWFFVIPTAMSLAIELVPKLSMPVLLASVVIVTLLLTYQKISALQCLAVFWGLVGFFTTRAFDAPVITLSIAGTIYLFLFCNWYLGRKKPISVGG